MKNIVITISLILMGCNPSNTKNISNEEKFDIYNPSLKKDLDDAIIKGDTLSYNRAFKLFLTHNYNKEFLFYSMIMAEKNKYKRAYYDTYMLLHSINDDNGYNYNSRMSEYFLLKAYESGDKSASEDVKWKYKEKGIKIPSSISVLESK